MSKLFKKSIISFVLLLAFLLTNISPAFASTVTPDTVPEKTITAVEPTSETVKEQVTPKPDPVIEEVKEEPVKETKPVAEPPVVAPPVKETKPVAEPPVVAPPVKETKPVAEPPVVAPPVKETKPVAEPPVVAPPVKETKPVAEPPVVAPPVKETKPVAEPPVVAPPVKETKPVAEPPVVAPPVKETPPVVAPTNEVPPAENKPNLPNKNESGKPVGSDKLNPNKTISNKPTYVTLPFTGKSTNPKSSPLKPSFSILGSPTTPGQVTIDKFAVPVPGMVNTWDVTLRIEGMDTEKSSDIVLVIDRSGSMVGDRLAGAKTAAKAFVEALKAVPNTRIAVVSYASEYGSASTVTTHTGLLDVTNASNRTTLNNAINSLSAEGGTNTQAGLRAGAAVLATSTADQKNLVLLSDGLPTQSYVIKNVSTKLETYGQTEQTEDGINTTYQNVAKRTKKTMVASDYDYNTTIGIGTAPYSLIGTSGSNFYSHSNSAIAQAAMFKNLGADRTIWTIALETDANGDATLASIASPGKDNTASTADLNDIFSRIAGSINAAAKNIKVTDPMGPGFVPSNIVVSQGTTSGTITWTVGDLYKPISPGSKIKYAQMTYRVTITDDILAETPVASKYPTNGAAKVVYTNSGNSTQTEFFPVPKVNPIFLKVKKTLLDASGNPVTAGTPLFSIKIKNNSSSAYNETFLLSPNQQKVSTNLRLGDTYTISETTTDYDVTFKVNDVVTNTFTVESPSGNPLVDSGQADIEVEVINKAKTRDIKVTKVWDGGKTPRDPVTINLLADGDIVGSFVMNDGVTTHTFTGLPVKKGNGTAIVYTISENPVTGYITTYNQSTFTVTNKFDVGKKNIPVTKVWVGGPSPKPAVTINLLADGVKVDSHLLPSGTLTYTFTNKPIYKSNGDLIVYTISEDTVAGYSPTYDQTTLTVTNNYDVGKKDIPVTKVWLGGPSPRPSVTINLLADGVEVKEFEMVNGVTTHTFTNLPIKKTDGTPIVYTISEDPVAGYITSYDQTTLTVTNDFDEGKKDIPVSKVWLDGPNPKPSVTINLLADGVKVDSHLLPNGTLTYTFTNKPIYKSNGDLIVYTISEDTVAGYTPTYNQSTLTVTNKYDVGKKDIPVTKVWLDGPSPKPSVTINLLADGVEVKEFVMVNGVTTHTFTDLPIKKTDGTPIVYTISEDPVAGYITSYNQTTLTVTNDFDEGKKDIPVSKIWLDGPDPKPSVTINLLADGVEVDQVTLLSGTLTHTFTNKPIYNSNGTLIVYTISEDTVAGYSPTYNQTTLTVSNKFDVGKKDIPVSKVWLGGPSPKPAVTINLLADGTKVDHFEMIAGVTAHTFVGLPVKNTDGSTIVYTVSEEPVEGYITSYNQQTLTVTNDYDEGSKDIPVNKIWVGGPSPRPSITINLLADGVEVDEFVMVNGITAHTFIGLPVRKSTGETIVYTISEDPVSGYFTSYNQEKLTVTNNFDVGKKDIPVSKVWLDGPNPKPAVTINLLADGVKVDQFTLPSGTLTHTFTDKPVYKSNGDPIVYTISEEPVAGYITTYNQQTLTVTNDYDEGSKDIPVTKVWDGGPSPRLPVTINLLADGVEVDQFVMIDGVTTHTFMGLPVRKSNGDTIVYTISEDPIVGYSPSYNQQTLTVTNKFDVGKKNIPVNKVWIGGPSPRPDVTINLLADGVEAAQFVMVDGVITHTFVDVPVSNLDGTTIVYTITEDPVPGYNSSIEGFTATNDFDEGSRDIPVTKIWEGGPLVKPAVTINLLADGLEVAEVVLLDGDTTHLFTGLPIYNSDGTMIVYTLTEEPVDGYITSIVGFMVTNNFDEGSRDIPVNKNWEGGPSPRPSVTINLLADGNKVADFVMVNGVISHTFTGLPVYNSDGTTIVYSITENTVEGYITTINGFTVTNNFDEGSRDIPVTKIWEGGPLVKPAVTINLLADGLKVAEVVLLDGDTTHTFTGLPMFNSDGSMIVYTLTEEPVDGYITSIVGFMVTNNFDEGSRDIPVDKIWKGGPLVKPAITINLLADGVEVAEVVLLDGSTTHTFMGLPVYNSDGTTIIYTITENPVEGYISSIDGFEVTNDFDEGLKDISIEKIWVGGPETKPAITINLLADGMEIRQVTLIDMVNYTFTGLPIMKSDGTVINYTITEDPVAGYISSINGFEVTNDFDEGLKDIPVNKIWVGGPLVKPSITINLMADGTDVDSVVLENGTTEYIFKDLPVYNSDGTTIVYAISENYVPGYISSIEGFTATNDFDESSRDITVTKVWEGGIGARPTITINLLADGVEVAQVELPAGDTEHTFTGLPVFKSDGTAIVYTITEDPTENYETTIEEFTVFNTWNGELPYTGTTTSTTLPIAGLLLAFTGVALVMRKRHNT